MHASHSARTFHAVRSILVIDDNKADYEAAAYAFREAACNTPMHWCQSGQETLDFLQHANESKKVLPSLILLDLHMPGIDGHETLKRIKGSDHFKQIPVVIMTSSKDEHDVAASYQTWVNTYLQKPNTIAELVEIVKRLKGYWFDIALLPRHHIH